MVIEIFVARFRYGQVDPRMKAVDHLTIQNGDVLDHGPSQTDFRRLILA